MATPQPGLGIPSSSGLRYPTDNAKNNGRQINPPRFAEMGGLTGGSKTAAGVNNTGNSNSLRLSKPSDGGR